MFTLIWNTISIVGSEVICRNSALRIFRFNLFIIPKFWISKRKRLISKQFVFEAVLLPRARSHVLIYFSIGFVESCLCSSVNLKFLCQYWHTHFLPHWNEAFTAALNYNFSKNDHSFQFHLPLTWFSKEEKIHFWCWKTNFKRRNHLEWIWVRCDTSNSY